MNTSKDVIDTRVAISQKSGSFYDRLRVFIRSKGLSYSTEKTYLQWVRRFVGFAGYSTPKDMQLVDVERFLNHLANDRYCSPNTQATALNALVFLFRECLNQNTESLSFNYAKSKPKVPVVLSQSEAKLVLSHLDGTAFLGAILMYGAGLRVSEVIRLRVKDVDFDNKGIYIMRPLHE